MIVWAREAQRERGDQEAADGHHQPVHGGGGRGDPGAVSDGLQVRGLPAADARLDADVQDVEGDEDGEHGTAGCGRATAAGRRGADPARGRAGTWSRTPRRHSSSGRLASAKARKTAG